MSVLAAKQSLDEEEYRADREQRAVVEREFHTAVEACIDIAGLLLGTTDATMPETYAERFQALEERGILSRETSRRMQQAAGFRTVLAHRYGDEVDGRRGVLGAALERHGVGGCQTTATPSRRAPRL